MSGWVLCDKCNRVLYAEDGPRCPECVVAYGPAPHAGYLAPYGPDAPESTLTGGDDIYYPGTVAASVELKPKGKAKP